MRRNYNEKKLFSILTATMCCVTLIPFNSNAYEKQFSDYTFEELVSMSDEDIMNIPGEFVVEKDGEKTTKTTGSIYSEYLEKSKFVIDNELDPDNPRATNEKIFFSFTKEIVDKYESYFVGEYYTGDFNGQLEKVYYINVGEENKAKFSELICIPQNIILDYSADYLYMDDEVVSYNGIWINPMAYGQENAYKTRALCIMFLDPRVNSNVSLYIENYKGSEKGDADCKGDANCDGNVNMADAVLIMQNLSNPDKYPMYPQGRINADMDGNGMTNADALAIQKAILKLS